VSRLFAFLGRAWFKLVVGPLRYGAFRYDAKRYWTDRYRRLGIADPRSSGDESKTQAENIALYVDGFSSIRRLTTGVDFGRATVLDIGCGAGHYARFCLSLGVKDYLGLDIVDGFLPSLRRSYPTYAFAQADCTKPLEITGAYDLILVIDVLEHITTDDGFAGLIENIKTLLAPGGTVVIGPVFDTGKKRLFYLRNWAVRDLEKHFGEWNAVTLGYKGGVVVAYTKPKGDA
jgi:2-polyprenyl-3-methyl-5-hydroxy-6-metoxy-1,4-benzoquinol methylase